MRRTIASSGTATALSLGLALARVAMSEGSVEPDPRPSPLTLSADRPLSAEVYRALLLARRSLGGAGCRQVFADFRDASGHTLQENLDALHEDGQGFLTRITFVDGGSGVQCRMGRLAYTTPGGHLVTYCGAFLDVAREDPKLAAAVLVHEELHTLGLGENPPTSTEITRRVRARCGL
jgi:hypothetical protein